MEKNYGFTLVESAVVLTILAIITAGILTGKDMIRSADLRAVMSDFELYKNAFKQFDGKYAALPGDMPNATDMWGIRAGATGSDATCWAASSTDKRTCNGDGNGEVLNPFNHATHRTEMFLVWQHLSNAGMIEGQFTGTAGSGGTYHHVAGQNTPESSIKNASWSFWTEDTRDIGQTDFFENHDGEDQVHQLYFGESTNSVNWNPAVTPEEAWMIDKKMDDGHPAYGSIFAPKSTSSFAPNCTTGGNAANGRYNLSYTQKACPVMYYRPFGK